MSGEHNTPVGTPVVIAPGKVFVVGEYAVLEEGSAVQAAIARYAKAQFIPRMESMPPLMAEIVRRMKSELGEVASALPPGGVMVTSDDFRRDGQLGGLGSSAAIAVASAGAVLECLGLAIEPRRQQIHRVADAARRAVQGNVGSGADTAASTYGGLVRITRPKGKSIEVAPMTPPGGLHVVLFSAGASIPSHQVVEGIQRYATIEPGRFGKAMAELRETAQHFIAQVETGSASGAIASAGQYGERLQELCGMAGVPIVTEAFARAADLAREFGGIAKPTGAGGGALGVALFATPEAVRWFRKACTEPLLVFDGDMDPSGVRCQFSDAAVMVDLDERDSAATPSPEPDEVSLPAVSAGPRIEASLHDAVTAKRPVEEPDPVDDPAVKETPRPHRHKRLGPVLITALALVLLVVLALVGAHLFRATPTEPTKRPAPQVPPSPTSSAEGAEQTTPSGDTPPAGPGAGQNARVGSGNQASGDDKPRTTKIDKHGHRTTKIARPTEDSAPGLASPPPLAHPEGHSASAGAAPARPTPAPKTPAPRRAGSLSPADF
jgi:phosphomevalonate kinase